MKSSTPPKLFVEIKEPDGTNSFRPVTKAERRRAVIRRAHLAKLHIEAKRIEKEIASLKARCDHAAFYDTPGFGYDVRTCYACGAGLGLI